VSPALRSACLVITSADGPNCYYATGGSCIEPAAFARGNCRNCFILNRAWP